MNGDAGNSAAGVESSATALLDALAQLLRKTMSPLLDGMFSNCDKVLGDLANDAAGTHDEQRLLDFRRELQHKQSSIAARFVQQLMSGFGRLQRPQAGGKAPAAEELSLVPQEQLERQLLVASSVSRVRNEAQLVLAQLYERLRFLSPAAGEMGETDNPLDPGLIAQAFLEACEEVESDIRCLRLLCQQFDAHVLGSLGEVYQRSNEVLIDARILPFLEGLAGPTKRSVRGRAAAARPASAEPAQPATPANSAPGFDELSALLQRVRGAKPSLAFASMPALGAAPLPASAGLGNAALATLLGELPHASTAAGNGNLVPMDIRTALQSITALRGPLHLGADEGNVVDIVTLIFDTVTGDADLPEAIRDLLSRLQLPVLKLALADGDFFNDRKHPARCFINAVARAGRGWDGHDQNAQDTLLTQMQALVNGLAAQARIERGSFAQALQQLQEQIERVEQRAIKLERRTSERAVAEARLTTARDTVHAVMREKLDGHEFPVAALDFFNTDWQRVLQLFFLRKGLDSNEWLDAVAMLDDLPRSLIPPRDGDAQVALSRAVPALYERLELALEQTQGNTVEAQARLATIRKLHRELLETSARADSRVVPIQRARIQPPPMIPPRSRDPVQPVAVQKSGDDEVPRSVLNLESMQRADAVAVGTWFEIHDRAGNVRRCKLSTRVDETRTLLFCDRNGRLVHEASRKAFAYALQTGEWRIIEDEPLLDRTLDRIAGDLRRRAGVA